MGSTGLDLINTLRAHLERCEFYESNRELVWECEPHIARLHGIIERAEKSCLALGTKKATKPRSTYDFARAAADNGWADQTDNST